MCTKANLILFRKSNWIWSCPRRLAILHLASQGERIGIRWWRIIRIKFLIANPSLGLWGQWGLWRRLWELKEALINTTSLNIWYTPIRLQESFQQASLCTTPNCSRCISTTLIRCSLQRVKHFHLVLKWDLSHQITAIKISLWLWVGPWTHPDTRIKSISRSKESKLLSKQQMVDKLRLILNNQMELFFIDQTRALNKVLTSNLIKETARENNNPFRWKPQWFKCAKLTQLARL